MIAYSSLFAIFIMERVGEMIGLICLFALNLVALIGAACDRLVSRLNFTSISCFFIISLPV